MEVLLTKCKETIKANKERTQQLVSDKEAVQKQLELKTQEHDLLKVSHAASYVYCMTSGSLHFILSAKAIYNVWHRICKRTLKTSFVVWFPICYFLINVWRGICHSISHICTVVTISNRLQVTNNELSSSMFTSNDIGGNLSFVFSAKCYTLYYTPNTLFHGSLLLITLLRKVI